MSAATRTKRKPARRSQVVTRGRTSPSAYRLFEVAGLELEYAVVDAEDLRPRCLVEDLFRQLAGRATSDVEQDGVGFSNELAAHVFEMKMLEPARDLGRAEEPLVRGVRCAAQVLRHELGARLLPTGMHPFMRPRETHLWRRSGRRVYETYARIFPIDEHGWLNVQSCQINLPFGEERETATLLNAIACIMPYLPALTASSPFVEGEPGPCVDNRLAFYESNQRRFPIIAGRIVPEYMTSYAQYRRDVLQPIYRALDRVAGGERLQHEWVNSRGAILRFDRRAIEIRSLDLQECVHMDIAVAIFVRNALRQIVRRLQEGTMRLPSHDELVADFAAVVRRGGRAPVRAAHLLPGSNGARTISTASVLQHLLELAALDARPGEQRFLRSIEARLRDGNLSESIRRHIGTGVRGTTQRRAAIVSVYRELADCLERNVPWLP